MGCFMKVALESKPDHQTDEGLLDTYVLNNNNILILFIWYSATSIIVRGASQHITI